MSGPDTPTKELVNERPGNNLPALQLANIVVKEKLGVGGFGAVYVGYHELMQRNVAIKVLKNSGGSTNWTLRFQREAQALSKLSHPNIVQVYSFKVTDSEQAVLIMEYLDGKNLQQLVDSEGSLSPEKAVSIAKAIADAMQCAHEQGILHRDLKPSNIFICSNGQVKVLDFGVAKLLEPGAADQKLTSTGQFVGTPAYMSPEECAGKPASPASDIYAIGCILYFMLTGEALFSANTDIELMLKHCKETPKLKRLALSDELVGILARALKKDPAARFSDCKELKDALASDAVCLPGRVKAIGKGTILKVVGALIGVTIVTCLLVKFGDKEKRSLTETVSQSSVDSWIREAWTACANQPDKALLLVRKAEAQPGLTDQQRWTIHNVLDKALPTRQQKLDNALKMQRELENPQRTFSRTARNYKLAATYLTVAGHCIDDRQFEANLAKAANILKNVDRADAFSETYQLWANYYHAKVQFYYHDRKDYRAVVSSARESYARLNEPIFSTNTKLVSMYIDAMNAATKIGDLKSRGMFCSRIEKTYFASTEDVTLANGIVGMLLTNGLQGSSEKEKLSTLRKVRATLPKHVSNAQELLKLDTQILKLLLESCGDINSDLLSSAEQSQIRKAVSIENITADNRQARSIIPLSAIIIASDYDKSGPNFATKEASYFLDSKQLSAPLKLIFIADTLTETLKRSKPLSPEFKSFIENSYLSVLKEALKSKNKQSAADWESINASLLRLEGGLRHKSLFYSKEFAENIHNLCMDSKEIGEISKIATIEWICVSDFEPNMMDLKTINRYRKEFIDLVSQLKELKPGFDTVTVLRCAESLRWSYELKGNITESLILTDDTTSIFARRNYFNQASTKADVISDWINQRWQKLLKHNIPVDSARLNSYVDDLRAISNELLCDDHAKFVIGLQDAVAIFAFNGESKKAYAVAEQFDSLCKSQYCLPSMRIGILCAIPKALVHGRIEPPTEKAILHWKSEFMEELSRGSCQPINLLCDSSLLIQNIESIAYVLALRGDGKDSVQFVREAMNKMRSSPDYLDGLHEWKLLDLIHQHSAKYNKLHHVDLMEPQELKRYNELPRILNSMGINYYAYWNNLKL